MELCVAAELRFETTGKITWSATTIRLPTRTKTVAPDPADNAELRFVRSVLAGDPRATELFVERMRCIPRFLHQRNGRLGRPLSPEEIADLSQEVFAALWSKLGEFRGDARLETWAYRFCACKYLEQGRDGRTPLEFDEQSSGSQHDDAAALAATEHDDALLLAAVDALPEDERAVVLAKHFEDHSFDAIGKHQRTSVSTVKARYYRALERLRARLGRAFRGAFDE